VALLLEQYDGKSKASAPKPAPSRQESPRQESPRQESSSRQEPSPRQESDDTAALSGERPRRRRRRPERPERPERATKLARMAEASGASRDSRMPALTETIDASDGKEFWEAWVDSKNEPAAPSAPEPKRERDKAQEAPLPEGHVRLYLNLGRRDGAREPEIESLLRESDVSVGSMELRNSHTYLIVAEDRADAVIAALLGRKFGEREVVCERARPK
jgi:hypothetical protein